ncbi:MAG: hypothetical protein Tsb009_18790 [Planctomycetaceae bacterium]
MHPELGIVPNFDAGSENWSVPNVAHRVNATGGSSGLRRNTEIGDSWQEEFSRLLIDVHQNG